MELRSSVTSYLFFLGVLIFVADLGCGGVAANATSSLGLQQGTNHTLSTTYRKLIHRGGAIADCHRKRRHGDKCSKFDIEINQDSTVPLPNGIPAYIVEIMNTCVSGCKISHIHLSCGWFSSATLINPRIFKRLSYNDCLVNNGKPLLSGRIVSFQYANSFPYALSVSSMVCHH